MREPERVADCVAAMKASRAHPGHREDAHRRGRRHASAKRRAAIAQVSEEDVAELHRFVTLIRDAGCEVAIVHARKAVLGGLSPKENREVPPLRYDIVRDLKHAFATLPDDRERRLPRRSQERSARSSWCDGVMLGREAYHRPFVLAQLDAALYGGERASRSVTREAMLDRMAHYAAREAGERGAALRDHPAHAGALQWRARCEGVPPDAERRSAGAGRGPDLIGGGSGSERDALLAGAEPQRASKTVQRRPPEVRI